MNLQAQILSVESAAGVSTPEHREAVQRADARWVDLEGVGHNLDHPAGWAPSLAALQHLLEAAQQFLSGDGNP